MDELRFEELSQLLSNRLFCPCKQKPKIFKEKGYRFIEFNNASVQESTKDEGCGCDITPPPCQRIAIKTCLKRNKCCPVTSVCSTVSLKSCRSDKIQRCKPTKCCPTCSSVSLKSCKVQKCKCCPTVTSVCSSVSLKPCKSSKSQKCKQRKKVSLCAPCSAVEVRECTNSTCPKSSQKDVNINFQLNMQKKQKERKCSCKNPPIIVEPVIKCGCKDKKKKKKEKSKIKRCSCGERKQSLVVCSNDPQLDSGRNKKMQATKPFIICNKQPNPTYVVCTNQPHRLGNNKKPSFFDKVKKLINSDKKPEKNCYCSDTSETTKPRQAQKHRCMCPKAYSPIPTAKFQIQECRNDQCQQKEIAIKCPNPDCVKRNNSSNNNTPICSCSNQAGDRGASYTYPKNRCNCKPKQIEEQQNLRCACPKHKKSTNYQYINCPNEMSDSKYTDDEEIATSRRRPSVKRQPIDEPEAVIKPVVDEKVSTSRRRSFVKTQPIDEPEADIDEVSTSRRRSSVETQPEAAINPNIDKKTSTCRPSLCVKSQATDEPKPANKKMPRFCVRSQPTDEPEAVVKPKTAPTCTPRFCLRSKPPADPEASSDPDIVKPSSRRRSSARCKPIDPSNLRQKREEKRRKSKEAEDNKRGSLKSDGATKNENVKFKQRRQQNGDLNVILSETEQETGSQVMKLRDVRHLSVQYFRSSIERFGLKKFDFGEHPKLAMKFNEAAVISSRIGFSGKQALISNVYVVVCVPNVVLVLVFRIVYEENIFYCL